MQPPAHPTEMYERHHGWNTFSMGLWLPILPLPLSGGISVASD